MAQRVALLSGEERLGVELLALVGEERRLNLIGSPAELARRGLAPDVVLVDLPAERRGAGCRQVRHHYRGPLIVLLDQGEDDRDLPRDHNRTLLTRPFWMHELATALAASAPAAPASDPAGHPRGRRVAAPAVLRLWNRVRDRRLVPVAVFSATLLLMGASALVVQDRCGPACDVPASNGPARPSTTVSRVVAAPKPTGSGTSMVRPTTTRRRFDPTVDGDGRAATATSGRTRMTTTTAGSSRAAAPGPTSPPDPTRPPSTAPPTTAPPTTVERPTTTTTTTTAPAIGP
jgi:hypothetical protein